MDTKIIAYYLPAFHEIEENNKWYGKGFTEWNTTKNAKKLFRKHNQPRVPLNENYYDLSNPQIIVDHMNLAKEYGVYGFCFYHYWFDKKGKTVLQKPLESLVNNHSATIHYCLAWCNESWRKTWHANKGESQLLIEQKYEGIEDWEAHFNYLLKFFKDDMYIKQDNKPVLLIYRIENLPKANEMINYFDKRARENGFSGVSFVQMMNRDYVKRNDLCAYYLDFEPNMMIIARGKYAYRFWRLKLKLTRKSNNNVFLNTVNYKSFYNSIIRMNKERQDSKELFGMFCDWDNSPRKGRSGVIFRNSSPKTFRFYLEKLYNMASSMRKPYIFVFAWNEWGEGGYLDPDTKNKYGYLEAIKSVTKGDIK